MTTNRTNGPWRVDPERPDIVCNDTGYIAKCYGVGSSFAECRANAAFIVRACNAHDDLVAALNAYDRAVSEVIANWAQGDLAAAINALEDLRDNEAQDALAKVKP